MVPQISKTGKVEKSVKQEGIAVPVGVELLAKSSVSAKKIRENIGNHCWHKPLEARSTSVAIEYTTAVPVLYTGTLYQTQQIDTTGSPEQTGQAIVEKKTVHHENCPPKHIFLWKLHFESYAPWKFNEVLFSPLIS